jgi:hypothetical protein
MRSLRPLCLSLLFVQSAACIQIGEDVTGQSASLDMDVVGDQGGDGVEAPDSAPDQADACAACGDQACVGGACVECADHMDCKDVTRPVCDTSTNTCVECVTTDNCGDGRSDTMGRPVCDVVAQRCVACVKDSGCASAEVCDVDDADSAANKCVGCLVDGDCTGGGVCDVSRNVCVECLEGKGCSPGVCKVSMASSDANECVECLDKNQCKDPSKSRCDMAVNACAGCMVDDDCTQVPGELKICDAGTCRQCTVDDESACGGKSCDPVMKTCTTTLKGSVANCGACIADSECKVADGYRCVPLSFGPTATAQSLGGFCLLDVSTLPANQMTCPELFKSVVSSVSLSGQPQKNYCGVGQILTTCEAVLDLSSDKACMVDADCGVAGKDDAKCVSVVGDNMHRCTIPCARPADCNESAGQTCRVLLGAPTNSQKYCLYPGS